MEEGKGASVFTLARSGDVGALSALLSTNPRLASSVDDRGVPLLHVAVETDDPRLVEIVLDCGADLEVRAPWGQTAFEWAANVGARAAAGVFLERGVELDLWTAAALGLRDDVNELLENGDPPPGAGRVPTPGADLSGWPATTAFRMGDHVSDAFYIACRNGALAVARDLRDHGADIDAAGYFGATALHWAALGGHEEVVEWLVDSGADVGRRDPRFDSTPAGWAREGGHEALADRLERLE